VSLFRRGAPAEARPSRARVWPWVVAAEVAAAAALWWATPAPQGPAPPVFRSVTGDFDAVAAEGDALLAAWDYPRAILLLWQAADAGVEPVRCHTHVARLFYDYQAYLNHYERGGLPAGVREQWLHEPGTAGRGWAAHALAELRTAHALAPDDFVANYALGQLLCSEGREEEGLPHLRAALDAQPDHVELLCDLAGALTRVGETGAARELADRLETLAPDHPRLRQLLDVLEEPTP